MNKSSGSLKRFFVGLWKIFSVAKRITLNLIFIVVVVAFIGLLSSGKNEIIVPNQSALVLNIQGDLVEQKRYVDPMDAFLNKAVNQQEEDKLDELFIPVESELKKVVAGLETVLADKLG